jgi:AcrR family transcriptional regulator
MLLYHFGSKEALVAAALAEVRRREIAMLGRALTRRPHVSTADVMRSIWRWYASPRRLPYLRLFFEAWGVSLQRPDLYGGFLDNVRRDMLPIAEEILVRRGIPRREARAHATFLVAAMRGLLIDLVTNRDRRRLDDAMEVYIRATALLEAAQQPADEARPAAARDHARHAQRSGKPRPPAPRRTRSASGARRR